MASRRGSLAAGALLVLLCAAAGANAARRARPRRETVPHLLIFFKEDVRGIGTATEQVRVGTAASLSADAGALRAASASGPGAYAVIAAMGRPFEITYVTPYEVDPQGEWIPGTNAVVRLHPLLSGRGEGAIDAVELVRQAVQAQPGVRYVVNSLTVQEHPTVACGPTAAGPCPAGQCCSASSGTCGTGDAFCGDACMPNYGFVTGIGCTNTALERVKVLNTGVLGSSVLNTKLPSMSLIDATFTNPTTKKLQTAKIGPAGVAKEDLTMMVWDSGVGPHFDLNIVGGHNFVADGEITTKYMDVDDHGTHCAGTIGAMNDGVGAWGVLPNARIWSARKFAADENIPSDKIEALRYIRNFNNPDKIVVVNMSFGGFWGDSPENRALKKDICDTMAEISNRWGTVFVAAAGNEYSEMDMDLQSPVFCKTPIIVTAIDTASCKSTVTKNPDKTTTTTRRCKPPRFSNWLNNNAGIADKLRTVIAPGVGIYSTEPNGKYQNMDGTSMATPHVAGIALKCFVSGQCQYGNGNPSNTIGTDNTAKILTAFTFRNNDPSYKWTDGTTTWVAPDGTTRYYGPLAWAGAW